MHPARIYLLVVEPLPLVSLLLPPEGLEELLPEVLPLPLGGMVEPGELLPELSPLPPDGLDELDELDELLPLVPPDGGVAVLPGGVEPGAAPGVSLGEAAPGELGVAPALPASDPVPPAAPVPPAMPPVLPVVAPGDSVPLLAVPLGGVLGDDDMLPAVLPAEPVAPVVPASSRLHAPKLKVAMSAASNTEYFMFFPLKNSALNRMLG